MTAGCTNPALHFHYRQSHENMSHCRYFLLELFKHDSVSPPKPTVQHVHKTFVVAQHMYPAPYAHPYPCQRWQIAMQLLFKILHQNSRLTIHQAKQTWVRC